MMVAVREPGPPERDQSVFRYILRNSRWGLPRIRWRCAGVLLATGGFLPKCALSGPIRMRRIWQWAGVFEHGLGGSDILFMIESIGYRGAYARSSAGRSLVVSPRRLINSSTNPIQELLLFLARVRHFFTLNLYPGVYSMRGE